MIQNFLGLKDSSKCTTPSIVYSLFLKILSLNFFRVNTTITLKTLFLKILSLEKLERGLCEKNGFLLVERVNYENF